MLFACNFVINFVKLIVTWRKRYLKGVVMSSKEYDFINIKNKQIHLQKMNLNYNKTCFSDHFY